MRKIIRIRITNNKIRRTRRRTRRTTRRTTRRKKEED